MKLTLSRDVLLKSLGHVQSVVERRNTIPILANVLIRVTPEGVFMTATDMEIEINEAIEAHVSKTGSVTAPAHTLYEIVRKLPDGADVELNASSAGQLTLSSGRSHFKLGCLPVEDFPVMPDSDLTHTFRLSSTALKDMVDRARFAMSSEETRYYLNGLYMHATKNGKLNVLRMVATDGHRLARVEMPAPEGSLDIPGVILPRKTVGEVRKLIDESAEDIDVSLSETKVRFTIGGVVITSKLIDGTFPDYERVIPAGNDKMLEVDAKVLAAAVDRVATISTEKSRAIKMGLSDETIVLSASSSEAGSAQEEIEARFDGAAIEIGFNAQYLLDILQRIGSVSARFMLADSTAPALIQDVSDGSALYVLMPMRV
ncbi:MAG: DNA polymerase III subunit beta [Alphaproteobacteria bacterium]|nr:DNA polymerase III subunit beta [Alphaproteobacteria bacterium]